MNDKNSCWKFGRIVEYLLFVAGAAMAIAGLGLAITNGPMALEATEGDSVARLERQIVELEKALATYTDAEAVIVIRDDGECGLRWWEAGRDLGCGTAWCRYRLTLKDGGTLTTFDGAVPK